MYYVAPSFTNYPRESEPYEKGGKMYVDVRHPNTGNVRSVRAYTEKEFNKTYAGKAASTIAEPTTGKYLDKSGIKKARGFSQGPITLINTKDKDFLNRSNARYGADVGWYFVSEEPIPAVPDDALLLEMTWEQFCEMWKGK
jgi:hypothetical protein